VTSGKQMTRNLAAHVAESNETDTHDFAPVLVQSGHYLILRRNRRTVHRAAMFPETRLRVFAWNKDNCREIA
jgi:hypothetical protein